MRLILLLFLITLISNCSKQKTVLICGDHVCVNKKEAEQFFEENLSLEVKIIDKKIKEELNLIELNMSENSKGKKQINIVSKKKTNNKLKILSNTEIDNIKKSMKKKKRERKIAKRTFKQKEDIKENIVIKKKRTNNVFDVCTILEKCNIDEISKYLLEQGKKKGYPDIRTK